MSSNKNISRILGVAFLFQFITSFSSGFFFEPGWLIPGDIHATLLRIAERPGWIRANILVDMLTAAGIIFLGVILFMTLRNQNEKIALTALGFYILEAGLLAASRIMTFSLLRISQEYASAGQPDALLSSGNLMLESMNFGGDTLHMLAFCLGGILFYYLLDQSGLVPRILSLWGLIAILPHLAGTLADMLNVQIPDVLFVSFLPYVPFEFVIGVWILVRGLPEIKSSLALTGEGLPTS